MRRLIKLIVIAAGMIAVLAPHNALAQRSAYGVEWACGYEYGNQFVQRLKRAYPEDLSCLAGAGFWEETAPLIGGRMDETRQRLRKLILLLLDDDDDARLFFEEEAKGGSNEAVLWLLIANTDAGVQLSSRSSRAAAVNTFITLPTWVRARFSSELASGLLAEGDSRAAITLATALETIAVTDEEIGHAAMIRARVVERYGTVNEAVALYDKAADYGGNILSAEAELRKIALMWRSGYLETPETVGALRELVTLWRGEALGAGITMALARAYYFDGQLPQALRLLDGIASSSAPQSVREEAERRIRDIAEDLFVRRTVESTIGDLMDVYELIRPIIQSKDEFWLGDLALSRMLTEAGLYAGARSMIDGVDPNDVLESGGQVSLLDTAELMLIFKDRDEARRYLDRVDTDALSSAQNSLFTQLMIEAAIVDDLPSYISEDSPLADIRHVSLRAWDAEAYGLFNRSRALLDEEIDWKDLVSTYLAEGKRLPRNADAVQADPRLQALSLSPKPSVYHTDDLRPLLTPSAEVVDLAVSLTRIGQKLETGDDQSASMGDADEAGEERAL
ncbi:MAG: hypothetical protein AAF511_08545 [Pseudomonadota bacterium]